MDKLYDYGLSELFLLIALAAAKKYQINLEFSHLDSSSFSVHGQYNQASSSEDKLIKKESDRDSERNRSHPPPKAISKRTLRGR